MTTKHRKPIFIHSLFRTGSTYIWNKFRQTGFYHCYFEPFHQELALLEPEDRGRWNSTPIVAASIRHPVLDREYMYEYRHLLRPGQQGVPFFRKSFSFDDFCNNGSNPAQKKYIDFLLESTGQRIPLLQFNRSALRAGWFKKAYPDVFHVYLLRDPRRQFASYLGQQENGNLDVFLLMNLLAVSVNMRSCNVFRCLARRLALFEFHAEDFRQEEAFYRMLLPHYPRSEQYFLHYAIWFAALLQALAHADMFLDIDLLSGNDDYRAKVSRRLQDISGLTLDFGDACVMRKEKSFLPQNEIDLIENEVRTMLLQEIDRKRIEVLADRFDAENQAVEHCSRKLWLTLRRRKLPAAISKTLFCAKQAALRQLLSPQTNELKLAQETLRRFLQIKKIEIGVELKDLEKHNDFLSMKSQALKAFLDIPMGKFRQRQSWLQVFRVLLKKAGLAETPVPVAEKASLRGGMRLAGFKKKSQPGLPLVTVVTVVLNETETLERTIESVLRQTYANIEFIIIDGGSTQPTLDVIKRFADKIDCWLSEPDRGIFDAMNKGIALAEGGWINFLNCGDRFYRDDTLQTIFSQDYKGADFIYGHTDFQGGDFRGVVKAWDFRILWKTMIFTHQSLFTRSEILKKRNFNTNFRICADFDLIYNSWTKGLSFHNSDTVIASFDPGFSDISRARMAWEKWLVVRRHRNDLPFHFFYLQLFMKRLFRDILFRLQRCFKMSVRS